MARVRINDLAKYGVIQDVDALQAPPNSWTQAHNVQMKDGKIVTALGQTAIYDPPSIPPYWLMQVYSPTKDIAWIYAGLTAVYTFIGGGHHNITRAAGAYSASADLLWNGGVLAGIPIINNGVDVPQEWATIDGSTPLINLTNWPVGYKAAIIRPYKNFLVAMDTTEGGIEYIHRIRWSSPAQPGGVPPSWDDTDPAEDAGIAELTDTSAGGLTDGLSMGDQFYFYKQRSIWRMNFVGGAYKMDIKRIFSDVGALSKNCVCQYSDPERHFVFTGEDVITHDGQSITSVVDKQLRRWIQSNIDSTYYNRSFVVPYTDEKECWVCIPTAGSTFPNLAIRYNYSEGTIVTRDLDYASHMAPGAVVNSGVDDSWDADTLSWDASTEVWDTGIDRLYKRQLVQASPLKTKIYLVDNSTAFDGVPFTATLTREELSVIDSDSNGTPISDTDFRKLVRGLWLQARGFPIYVSIGRVREVGGVITWSNVRSFLPGNAGSGYLGFLDGLNSLDCRTYAVKITWPSDAPGTLLSYDIDVATLGMY